MTRLSAFCLALLVAACGTANEGRYRIDPSPAAEKLRVAVATIEVRDVSLPAYASEPDIYAADEAGALRILGDSLWADEPVRGVTSALVRALSERVRATVAAEPWPLSEDAQVRLDVRVEEAFARADGVFVFEGQFAVASPDLVVREFVRRFEIAVPLTGEGSAAVADAQGRAIGELAEQVARSLR